MCVLVLYLCVLVLYWCVLVLNWCVHALYGCVRAPTVRILTGHIRSKQDDWGGGGVGKDLKEEEIGEP